MTRRNEKVILWWFYGVLSLSLLLWPVASFVAMFIFDAPMRGAWDYFFRYSMVFLIWLYPVFYSAGLFLSIRAYKKQRGGRAVFLPMGIPFLPVVLVILAGCINGVLN